MNPNHPHYAGLGGGPNLNLLDNMLMAAGFQVIFSAMVTFCWGLEDIFSEVTNKIGIWRGWITYEKVY